MGTREHPLRHEWGEFKRLRNGVETARTNRTEINGQFVPCVRVYVTDDASDEVVEEVKQLASELDLLPWTEDFTDETEYVFVQEKHIERYA